MHWSLTQDCLQPTSSDLTYQHHTLWLRAAHEPLIFEGVVACVQLANWEGKNDSSYMGLDERVMSCPRGAQEAHLDPHSPFGRAPFEVQSVDGGWLLEHSNGAGLGYVHANWSIHCPMRPELDPVLGLELTLQEIMVRPPFQGYGFGTMMVDKVVEAVGQHVHLLLLSHNRLKGMDWKIQCNAETISSQGERALARLEDRIKAVVQERVDFNNTAHASLALRH